MKVTWLGTDRWGRLNADDHCDRRDPLSDDHADLWVFRVTGNQAAPAISDGDTVVLDGHKNPKAGEIAVAHRPEGGLVLRKMTEADVKEYRWVIGAIIEIRKKKTQKGVISGRGNPSPSRCDN